MGVKGLWRLIAPVGKPVSLESLDGKVLAVDVSIWLNKAAKGMRDKHGNAIYNAHLVLMFHRICKLLFYGIKPVFVFDGGVPELKKKTLKSRKERRSKAESNKNKTKELMLKNYLQTKALEAVSGAKSSSKLNLADKKTKEDIFLLPAIPTNETGQSDSSSDDDVINEDEWLQALNEHHVQEMFDNPDTVDIDSVEFSSLPAEVKHELLTEIKDSHRRRYKRKNEEEIILPEAADDFSNFQLKNLMKRGHITQQIDSLRKEMNNSMTAQFISLYEDLDTTKLKNHHVEGKRYASNERQNYILVKNVKKKEENRLFNATLDEDYNRFKGRDQNNSHLFKKLEREPARFQTLVEQNASRKRLASESSEDLELQRHPVINDEDPCSSKSTSNVDFMSESSSENSEIEDTLIKKDSGQDKQNILSDNRDSNNLRRGQSIGLENTKERQRNIEGKRTEFVEIKQNKTEDLKNRDVSSTTIEQSIRNGDEILITVGRHSNKFVDTLQASKDKGIDMIKSPEEMRSNIPQFTGDEESKILTFPNDRAAGASQIRKDLLSPTLLLTSNVTSPLSAGASSIDETPTEVEESSELPKQKSHEGAVRLQNILAEEHKKLEEDTRKQSRQAATLSNETYQDVQELLRIFGIPYLVSPAEAEAQCAQLDYAKLTDGSITDDSDIFLFGGSRVYKNIFNQKKYAEHYSIDDLTKKLYLTREKLIALAFLTGSDYTEGLQGVGSITGMEVLQEFERSKPKETLKVFKDWLSGRLKDFNPGSNLRSKLRNVELSGTFNSSAVWEAYLSPIVETSDETFEWSNPDTEAIKEFANEKFGWLYSRTNEILKPVMQTLAAKRKRHKTLLAYFQPSFQAKDEPTVTSKRLQKILNKVAVDRGEPVPEEKKESSKKKKTHKLDSECYFQDDSIDADLLELPAHNLSRSSSKQPQQSQTALRINESLASPSKRGKVSHRLDTFSSNVSTNQHVQARKVSNLIKAAEETLKPQTPYVAMQHVNNIVRNKLLKGKKSTFKRTSGKKRRKVTASLLEAANSAQRSSVKSSSSDSD